MCLFVYVVCTHQYEHAHSAPVRIPRVEQPVHHDSAALIRDDVVRRQKERYATNEEVSGPVISRKMWGGLPGFLLFFSFFFFRGPLTARAHRRSKSKVAREKIERSLRS